MKTFTLLVALALSFVGTAQTTVEFWHTFGDVPRGG